jgi:hypothetical protein
MGGFNLQMSKRDAKPDGCLLCVTYSVAMQRSTERRGKELRDATGALAAKFKGQKRLLIPRDNSELRG